MNENQIVRISKFLSKHLRHQPERIGLSLERGGWVSVEMLLNACAKQGLPLTRAQLEEVVAQNNKQRFAFDETATKIRANQGHSIEVDLELLPTMPPSVLYHGTGAGSVEAILREGIQKMRRHHVHLSQNIDTAIQVGRRHGVPVVFAVRAEAMHLAGHLFFVSANGVWLTEVVPAPYLSVFPIPLSPQPLTN